MTQFELDLDLEDPIEIGEYIEPKWLFAVDQVKEQLLKDWPGWSTATELVRGLITPAMAMAQFNKLAAGGDSGYYISALFNPHRFDIVQGKLRDMVSASKDYDSFRKSSARFLVTLPPHGDFHPNNFPKRLAIGTGGVAIVAEFRPILAVQLITRFCPVKGARVLDPCHGWGGRVIGFLAADLEDSYYVGFDPSTRTNAGVKKLIAFLQQSQVRGKAEAHCEPFEEAAKKLPSNSFDFALTSPPYFDTEKYSKDEGDSATKFNTYDKWIKGFYTPLIKETVRCLKPGSSFVLNIGDNKYELTGPARKIARSIGCDVSDIHDMLIERTTGARGANVNQVEAKRESFLKITKPR